MRDFDGDDGRPVECVMIPAEPCAFTTHWKRRVVKCLLPSGHAGSCQFDTSPLTPAATTIEEAAAAYDREDQRKLGEWVQANLRQYAGLSWSEGIAREFARLRSEVHRLDGERERLLRAVDAFLTKHPAQIGSKSNREDYGSFVTTADLWALHEARLDARYDPSAPPKCVNCGKPEAAHYHEGGVPYCWSRRIFTTTESMTTGRYLETFAARPTPQDTTDANTARSADRVSTS